MCRPIEGNSVRSKVSKDITPLKGSTGKLASKKKVKLAKDTQGVAEGPARGFRDYFIILFEQGDEILRARMKHDEIKGIEGQTAQQ